MDSDVVPQVRSRLTDVAKAAGVSTATVDRVLHGRLRVRPATAQRVLKAAAALAYLPDNELWRTLRPDPMEIAFLLPAGTNTFLHLLADCVRSAGPALTPYNVQCRIATLDGFDPASVATALLRHGRRAQGVAFMALEHARVRDAIDQLADSGVHVITLVSDVSQSRRAAYVGMDNVAAGRTAARLLGRFLGNRAGSVALIAGSLGYRGHEERARGFLRLMESEFPTLRLVGVREGLDDPDTNYRLTRTLLREYPGLGGLYSVGGGTEGIGRALQAHAGAHRPVFIGHGLTPQTRAQLIDGTIDAVINADPPTIVLDCVRILTNLRDGRSALAGVEPTRINIVLRENLT